MNYGLKGYNISHEVDLLYTIGSSIGKALGPSKITLNLDIEFENEKDASIFLDSIKDHKLQNFSEIEDLRKQVKELEETISKLRIIKR